MPEAVLRALSEPWLMHGELWQMEDRQSSSSSPRSSWARISPSGNVLECTLA